MKILVTGGTGFVGSNLVRELVEAGHEVTITGCSTECKVEEVKILHLSLEGVDWPKIYGQDIVFHQAANNNTLDQDQKEMLRANLYGPIALFSRARDGGCKRFVYASSTAVYGNSPAPYDESETLLEPLNPYADSKARFDNFAMNFAAENKDLSVIGLRYCNVFGPGEEHKGSRASMIYQLATQMIAGKTPKLFKDGKQKRDWIYVKDVVRANMLASEYDGSGIFNCGSGVATSFNDLVTIINDSLKTSITPEYIDNPYEETYQTFTECNMLKAKEKLKFVPQYKIKDGIREYIEYMKKTCSP